MPNRLAAETSPYLLQHADNPVDWRPWGESALAEARNSGRPILLSIGYSACHWCHVMAHESFEDEGTAAVMNAHFIPVKVDREERPDLDQIYQTAHQLLTGRAGGWPLTLFLTPDGMPFFGGTYFPDTPRHGLPAFSALCDRIATVYRNQPKDVAEQCRELARVMAELAEPERRTIEHLSSAPLSTARDNLLRRHDARFGGFGEAPKFPQATDLALLLRLGTRGDEAALDVVLLTLRRMAEGGLYDQIGSGFFRYSVDGRWEIPHFEKMLYDSALLLPLYADAWAVTGDPRFARVAEETAGWMIADMQLDDGGFASSLDADSEGEEGRYYLWDRAEVRTALSASEWQAAGRHWGLAGPANFEGRHWHLRIAEPLSANEEGAIASARTELLALRARRTPPGRDDKVLTAWNALAIEGLAHAARVLARPDWLAAARRAFDAIWRTLRHNGRLLATARAGRAHLPAYLDDHAFLLSAVIELMQADFRPADAEVAKNLADALLARFEDASHGGFFFTAHDHETLIQRPRTAYDNPLPAGNAVAARALGRLSTVLDEDRYLAAATRTLKAFQPLAERQGGMSAFLLALDEALSPLPLVILRGPPPEVAEGSRRLARLVAAPAIVLPIANGTTLLPTPLDRPDADPLAIWICGGTSCLPPVDSLALAEDILQSRRFVPS